MFSIIMIEGRLGVNDITSFHFKLRHDYLKKAKLKTNIDLV